MHAGENLLHDTAYTFEVLYESDSALLALTRYPEYPVQIVNNHHLFLVLEGCLVDDNPVNYERELSELASHIFSGEKSAQLAVVDWLMTHDGDYLIVAHDRNKGEWAILTDPLARLPVYARKLDKELILSREFNLFRHFQVQDFDRMALSQYLALGYSAGKRTLLAGIERLPASLLINIGADGKTRTNLLHQWNLEQKHSLPFDGATDSLVSSFIKGCRRQRNRVDRAFVTLSGGLDSRAVAAGLKQVDGNIPTVTFGGALGVHSDVNTAREIAARFQLPWKYVELGKPAGSELVQILKTKGGIIQLSQAADIFFMSEAEKLFGRDATYFSGDGGHQLLPDLRPGRSFNSDNQLAKYILDRQSIMPLDIISKLCSVSSEDIIGSIEAILSNYPEQAYEQKYVRFLLYERAMRWLNEGEDRNRCYFWCQTPFFSLPFFRAAIACPDRHKSGHRIYAEFLHRLHAEATTVPYANYNSRIDSASFRMKMTAIRTISRFPKTLSALRASLRPEPRLSPMDTLVRCLSWQESHVSDLGEYFDKSVLSDIINRPERLSITAMDNLFTLTSALEYHRAEPASLREFSEERFPG
ncbi:MAG: asparagine synthase-related protein [candidate division Zixibacteria bacterium]